MGNEKRGLLVVSVLMLAAFGPYLTVGLRTEQVLVYAAAVLVVPLTFFLIRSSSHVAVLLAVWVVYVTVALVGVAAPPTNGTPWPFGQSMSGLDNLILPVAVIMIVLGLVALGADPATLLRRTAFLTVVLMSMNTLAVLAQAGGVEWTQWWGSDTTSTAMRAATAGRYSGLLNQPAEAGLLYGVALLCALYLWPGKPGRLVLAITFLSVGGVMTVSKLFLLVGLPLAAWALLRGTKGRSGRLAAVSALMVGGYVTVQSGSLPAWTGVDQLRQVIPSPTGNLTGTFTANRYGVDSTLGTLVDAVLNGPIWFGFGGRGLEVPYDSGFVEALVIAGLVGVGCYGMVLTLMFTTWRRAAPGRERSLFGFLLVLLAIASLGVPALTANRAATVVWLLLTALIASTASQDTRQDREPSLGRSRDLAVRL